ncbi:hypothetical protein EsH8_XIII_000040 [Colletotrichum jinshuiense]
MQGAARKKRLKDDIHKYYDELDLLCGRPLSHVRQTLCRQGARSAASDARDPGDGEGKEDLPEGSKKGGYLQMTPPPSNSRHINGSDAGNGLPPFDPLLSPSKPAEKKPTENLAERSADNPFDSSDAENSSPEVGRRGRWPKPSADPLFSPITSLATRDGGRDGQVEQNAAAYCHLFHDPPLKSTPCRILSSVVPPGAFEMQLIEV